MHRRCVRVLTALHQHHALLRALLLPHALLLLLHGLLLRSCAPLDQPLTQHQPFPRLLQHHLPVLRVRLCTPLR